MKKALSLILALIMLLSAAPITAYAATPAATNVQVTNAVGGVVTGSTVDLSWSRTGDDPSYSYEVVITKSYDGSNYTEAARKTSNVGKNTYTYSCVEADYNKTVYFGIQYEYSGSSSLHNNALRATSSGVLIQKPASAYDEEECKELMLKGLSDPKWKKTTENCNGYSFVKDSKAVWDCSLYTLTAKVTKVDGKKVTFSITFKSKIADGYIGEKGYSINIGTKTFYPGDKITYTLDTSKSDGSFDTSTVGMQYFRIRVERTQVVDPIIYSSNPYFAGIVKNHEVYPENSNYISRVYLKDYCYLSYYVKPDYKLSKNSYVVKKDSITLGTYGFASTVNYRKKGASSWKSKSFAKNKTMKISSLKENTVYEFQVLCKVPYTDPETNTKKYAVDLVDEFKLTTVINQKPKVTSVKVSKFKNGKNKTIPGYWESDGDYHPTETFKTATYTMTVKVKSVPKNAKGLVLKVGGSTYYATGNKKTYTFKLYYQDKKKIQGKKMKANFYWSSNTVSKSPLGVGPAKAKSYKIKNGTYK